MESKTKIPLKFLDPNDINQMINKRDGFKNGVLATGHGIFSSKYFCDGFLEQNSTLLPIQIKNTEVVDFVKFEKYHEYDKNKENERRMKEMEVHIKNNKIKYLNEYRNSFLMEKIEEKQLKDNKLRNVTEKDISLISDKNTFYKNFILKNSSSIHFNSEENKNVSNHNNDKLKNVENKNLLRNSNNSNNSLTSISNESKSVKNIYEKTNNIDENIDGFSYHRIKSGKELLKQFYEDVDNRYYHKVDEITDNLEDFKQKFRNKGIKMNLVNSDNSLYMSKLLLELQKTKIRLNNLIEYDLSKENFRPNNKKTVEDLSKDIKSMITKCRDYRRKTNELIENSRINKEKIVCKFNDLEKEFKDKNRVLQKDWESSFALAKNIKNCSKPFKTHEKVNKNDLKEVLSNYYHYPLLPNVLEKQNKVTFEYLKDRRIEDDNIYTDLITGEYFPNTNVNEIKKLKDFLDFEKRTELKHSFQILKKFLLKLDRNKISRIKPSKLKTYFNSILICLRIRLHYVNSTENVKLVMIKWYKQVYLSVKNGLKKYVYDIFSDKIKLLYFKGNLNMNFKTKGMNNYEDYNKKPGFEEEKKFSLINSFIKSLIKSICNNISKLDLKERLFLQYINSNNTIIPFFHFSLFELLRLKERNGYIVELNTNIKKMIVGIHIFIRILIIEVINNTFYSNETDKENKESLKSIASIIYYLIYDLFSIPEITDIVNENIDNFDSFNEYCLMQCNYERPVTKLDFKKSLPLVNRKAIANSYANSKIIYSKSRQVKDEINDVNKFIKEMKSEKNNKFIRNNKKIVCDKIENIEQFIFPRELLSNYFNMAKHYKFNLGQYFLDEMETLLAVL